MSKSQGRGARLAVDIGGTFTDVALETGERRITIKVLTTQDAPDRGVLQGITSVLEEAHVAPEAVGLIIHGTTLATNALIERKGARTAFVTTDGFRDVLETGYERRFEQYDIYMDKPPPLVPRRLRFTVPERVAADGCVLRKLDEGALSTLAKQLESEGIESISIGFLHSYVNAAHEERAREVLLAALPHLSVTISSEVSPEIREYDRFSTACANAYVQPQMAGYLSKLSVACRGMGLTCPLLLMTSAGGPTTIDSAIRFPIRLVESGPAGGAMLASHLARVYGLGDVLSFDMGGTTAKICLISDGVPERSRAFEVARAYRNLKGSGLPVRVPVIEMVEIGAGGGSLASVDAMHRIAVGPESAGSEPGPACYGQGGRRPAVTDANLVLHRLDAERFAGGSIKLDPAAARDAIAADVGRALGLDASWAAVGISEIVEENMANAARVHAIERGKVIERHVMIAFGGGAPLHACRVARKLGVTRILVPAGAGVGSAIGFLRAPISYQVTRSRYGLLADLDLPALNGWLSAMRAEARAIVEPGAPHEPLTETRHVDLRYTGQGHELVIALPTRDLGPDDLGKLHRDFEDRYRALYGLTLPDMGIETLTWSVTVSTEPEAIVAVPTPSYSAEGFEPTGLREVFDPDAGKPVPTPVYWRPDLTPGAEIIGPALIDEDETTTLIADGWRARIDGRGYIDMAQLPGNGGG